MAQLESRPFKKTRYLRFAVKEQAIGLLNRSQEHTCDVYMGGRVTAQRMASATSSGVSGWMPL